MHAPPTLARLAGVVRDNPGFRRLYLANAISMVGDWFNVVALYSLLLQLTGRGEAVALALLTRLVPMFVVGPAAGVLADRLPRRALMLASDLLRAALVLCLLFVRRPEHVPLAYAVMTAHSVLSAIFEPAQVAMIPSLVPAQDLVLASTLENSLWSTTLALGSALGGAVLALFGRDVAFACDALSFAGSALLIAGLPKAAPKRLDKDEAEAQADAREPGAANLLGLADLREGLRYVATDARVRALLVTKACFGLTLGGVIVLLAFFGERVFHETNGAGIAMLWTARGVGSFAGPFVAFRLVGHEEAGLRRGIGYAFATLVVCYCAFAASPSIALAVAALAVANAGGSILWTYASALVQQIVPDGIRGRVAAADMGGMTLTMTLSTLLTGHLLDRGTDPRALMAGCGLVALVPLCFWQWQQRAFRRVQPAGRNMWSTRRRPQG